MKITAVVGNPKAKSKTYTIAEEVASKFGLSRMA
ncbi:hypothetical protein FHS14_001475 [Paenibacillus baekrokdamisoli]|nr:NAD(P)H-dependent oxidoreductase [Paenibacillus baekrokdamisoli]MBB3068499.1 hypothetical protein [Paenibacillus baekrokdamisoli]